MDEARREPSGAAPAAAAGAEGGRSEPFAGPVTPVPTASAFHSEILRRVNDAIIAIDAAGVITYLNPSAERQYGVPAAEAVGRPLTDLYRFRWVDADEEARAAQALAAHGFWRGENLHVLADGRTLHVDSAVSALRGAAGEPSGLLAVIRDITAAKRGEVALAAVAARDALRAALADALRAASTGDEIQAAVVGVLADRLDVSQVVYGEAPEETDTDFIVRQSFWRTGRALAQGRYPWSAFGPLILPQLRAGATIVMADVRAVPEHGPEVLATYDEVGTRAYVVAPLVREGRVVAFLAVGHDWPRDWTTEEIALFEMTAERTWTATMRARADAISRERANWLRGQAAALTAAVDGAPLVDSLGALVATARDALGDGVRAAFYLTDGDHTSLRHVVGMPPAYAAEVDRLHPSPEFMAGDLDAHAGHPMLVADVRSDARWQPWLGLAERFGYRGCWCFPIHSGTGTLVGALAVYSREPREASPRDLELAGLLGHTAAIIISRHRETEVRRRAEEALRDSEERLRASEARLQSITDLVPDLLWQCEPDGSITWCNQRWTEYTGQPVTAALGWVAAIHPEEQDLSTRRYHEAVLTGAPLRCERRLLRHDGVYRWFVVAVTPLKDASGRVVKMYAAATDIHEQRQQRDGLEERVRERTAEVQALFRRMISVQEDERKRIARDIHDQLGQQMTALRMNLEKVARAGDHSPLSEQIERTQRVAEDLDESIDFLTWDLRPAALDHLGLTEALKALAHGWSARFGVAATCFTSEDAPVRLSRDVEANLYRIAQEALHNVMKHADATRVTITLAALGGGTRLSIEDDGHGFPASADGDDRAGTGLGLIGMRERSALAGGRLSIESHPGTGTLVTIDIPAPEA